MEYLYRLEKSIRENKKRNINKYVEVCVGYAEKILDKNMPVIFDIKHLSLLMGIKENVLCYYALYTSKFYREVTIPKKDGRVRHISIPSYNLKQIQKWILNNILYKIPIHEKCTSFIQNKSIVQNACMHLEKELIIKIDIEDFFDNISYKQVFNIFYSIGYTKEVAFILTNLLTYKGFLPQGSPASPYISNIVGKRMDIRMTKLVSKIGASYSRYADDLTISGTNEIYNFLPSFYNIVNQEGFSVNNRKTKIQHRNYRQDVTGIVVNGKYPRVKKEYKNKLRQEIYYCKKYGVYNHLKQIGCMEKSNFKEYIYGKAYYILMVEREVGERLLSELDELDWNV